jgi:hypothetical protein
MAFYAHQTELISPGDIYPELPFGVSIPPLRVARKSKLNPPKQFGPQDLRRLFVIPDEAANLKDLKLSRPEGEETLAYTRIGKGILLSWGSQVEADERDASTGKVQRKAWLAAPIFKLQDIPENGIVRDPDTGEELKMRDIVRNNLSHNYFYLPPFPSTPSVDEHYADFRRITPIGMQFFTAEKINRIATLMPDSLNGLYSRLMWFFTRAELFYRPVRCGSCGTEIQLDVRFHGQNFDAEPWQ